MLSDLDALRGTSKHSHKLPVHRDTAELTTRILSALQAVGCRLWKYASTSWKQPCTQLMRYLVNGRHEHRLVLSGHVYPALRALQTRFLWRSAHWVLN